MIPVAWYLILQLLGSNSFALELKQSVDGCIQVDGIRIVRTSDSVTIAERNYLQRVEFATKSKEVELLEKDEDFFDCINQSEVDLVLLNKEGLWGGYTLTREGVDLLLTELDILILQSSYGEGVER